MFKDDDLTPAFHDDLIATSRDSSRLMVTRVTPISWAKSSTRCDSERRTVLSGSHMRRAKMGQNHATRRHAVCRQMRGHQSGLLSQPAAYFQQYIRISLPRCYQSGAIDDKAAPWRPPKCSAEGCRKCRIRRTLSAAPRRRWCALIHRDDQ
jgi:hypothetical protein